MIGAPLAAQIPFLVAAAAFYLIPLLISARAKRDPSGAVEIVIVTVMTAILIMSALFWLGGALVGSLSFSDYLHFLAIYTLPSIPVLGFWLAVMRLSRRS